MITPSAAGDGNKRKDDGSQEEGNVETKRPRKGDNVGEEGQKPDSSSIGDVQILSRNMELPNAHPDPSRPVELVGNRVESPIKEVMVVAPAPVAQGWSTVQAATGDGDEIHEMLVKSKDVGLIIGTFGTVISNIREGSEANVKVSNVDGTTSVVRVAGKKDQVKKAKEAIEWCLKRPPSPRSFNQPGYIPNGPPTVRLTPTGYRRLSGGNDYRHGGQDYSHAPQAPSHPNKYGYNEPQYNEQDSTQPFLYAQQLKNPSFPGSFNQLSYLPLGPPTEQLRPTGYDHLSGGNNYPQRGPAGSYPQVPYQGPRSTTLPYSQAAPLLPFHPLGSAPFVRFQGLTDPAHGAAQTADDPAPAAGHSGHVHPSQSEPTYY